MNLMVLQKPGNFLTSSVTISFHGVSYLLWNQHRCHHCYVVGSRDNSVKWQVTGCMTGVRFPAAAGIFFSSNRNLIWDPLNPSNEGFSSEGKAAGGWSWPLTPFSSDDKNTWGRLGTGKTLSLPCFRSNCNSQLFNWCTATQAYGTDLN